MAEIGQGTGERASGGVRKCVCAAGSLVAVCGTPAALDGTVMIDMLLLLLLPLRLRRSTLPPNIGGASRVVAVLRASILAEWRRAAGPPLFKLELKVVLMGVQKPAPEESTILFM